MLPASRVKKSGRLDAKDVRSASRILFSPRRMARAVTHAVRFNGMNEFLNSLSALLGLGLEPKELTFLQISLRGVIVFLATLIIVRLSDRRSLTKKSPFDQILIVILASILSRAINGSSTFWSTIGGAAVLVLLHR